MKIVASVFGLLLLLSGLIGLGDAPAAAVGFAALGLMLIPATWDLVAHVTGYQPHWGLRAAGFVVLLFVSASLVPPDETGSVDPGAPTEEPEFVPAAAAPEARTLLDLPEPEPPAVVEEPILPDPSSTREPPAQSAPARPNCDPSYPGVCIPPYPPDLNCGDISYRRFRVVGRDPHGFDSDNDGIGCES